MLFANLRRTSPAWKFTPSSPESPSANPSWPPPDDDISGNPCRVHEARSPLFACRPAQQIPRKKEQVGGAFGQPPYEVREPVLSKRNVNAHAVAFTHEAALQVRANPVEHLEFELILGNAPLGGEPDGRIDHLRIVRGHGMVNTARQQQAHQLDIVRIDIFLPRKCDFWGLLVGAFHQTDTAADPQ